MNRRTVAALLLAGMLTLAVAPMAFAQSPTPVPTATRPSVPAGTLDARALADAMGQPEFRVVLLVTLIFGAMGGLVYELLVLQGSVEQPHRVQEGGWVYDLGVWGRMVMGSMAAVAALYVISPDDAYKLVAVAVVAGASASAIFKSLQSRVEAMVAQQAVAKAQDAAAQIAEKAEQMAQTLGIDDTGLSSTRGLRGPGAPSTEAERRAAQLLNEIRALNATLRRPSKDDTGT